MWQSKNLFPICFLFSVPPWEQVTRLAAVFLFFPLPWSFDNLSFSFCILGLFQLLGLPSCRVFNKLTFIDLNTCFSLCLDSPSCYCLYNSTCAWQLVCLLTFHFKFRLFQCKICWKLPLFNYMQFSSFNFYLWNLFYQVLDIIFIPQILKCKIHTML